jgi:hypothetical protein
VGAQQVTQRGCSKGLLEGKCQLCAVSHVQHGGATCGPSQCECEGEQRDGQRACLKVNVSQMQYGGAACGPSQCECEGDKRDVQRAGMKVSVSHVQSAMCSTEEQHVDPPNVSVRLSKGYTEGMYKGLA